MNRKVLLIAAAGALVLVAAWFLLLWSPQGTELDDARQRRASAEEANAALELRIDRLRDLRERRPELEADLLALEAAVPPTADLDAFLLDADAAADRSGVDLRSIAPTKPAAANAAAAATTTAPTGSTPGEDGTAAAPPNAIGLTLDASGGYFQVLDFMNRLDDLPRIVVVDSVSLAAGGGDGGDGGEATAETRTASSGGLTMSITARMFTTEAPAPVEGEAAATTTTTGGTGQ